MTTPRRYTFAAAIGSILLGLAGICGGLLTHDPPVAVQQLMGGRKVPWGPVRPRPKQEQEPSFPDDVEFEESHDTIPNFAREYDIITAQSGDWSDPATWDLNRVPEQDEIVAIQTTHTVTYDDDALDLYTAIGVAGTLQFSHDADTYLGVLTLIVYDGGTLKVGTVAQPIEADNTAEIVFGNTPLDSGTAESPGSDPHQYGNGLLGLGGSTITMHGAPKTRFRRVSVEPEEAHTSFTFGSAVSGWQVGDELTIPDTRQLGPGDRFASYVPQWETRTIASLGGGNTIANLSSALDNDHFGGEHGYGMEATDAPAFYPHVGNLTNNIRLRSEDGEGTRGHCFFTGRCRLDLRYVELKQLGRTSNADIDSMRLNDTVTEEIANGNPIWIRASGGVVSTGTVTITGATGNTAMNGTWSVQNIDGTTFALLGSTSNGAYTGGGILKHTGTNQIGRYAIHCHHLYGPSADGLGYDEDVDTDDFEPGNPANTLDLDGPSYRLVGCTVHDSLADEAYIPLSKWGVAIHDTHYGLIRGNVVHHYAGSNFVFEDGSETANVLTENFSCSCIGQQSQRLLDSRSGAGYSFHGFGNLIRNNVAAGCAGLHPEIVDGSGFYLVTQPAGVEVHVPLFQGADPHEDGEEINTINVPLAEFDGNEAYGAILSFATIWHLGTTGYALTASTTESVMSNCRAWNCGDEAFFGYPCDQLTFDNWIVRGDPDLVGVRSVNGFWFGDYWASNITIRNCDVRGIGKLVNHMLAGNDDIIIEDNYCKTWQAGIEINTPYTPGSGAPVQDHTFYINNCVFDRWGMEAGYHKLRMVYDYTTRANLRALNAVVVTDFDGVMGDDFRVYYYEQDADFEMPESVGSPTFLTACPEDGLTNAQAYVKYHSDGTLKVPMGSLADLEGCAIGGAVAPMSAVDGVGDGIFGLVDDMSLASHRRQPRIVSRAKDGLPLRPQQIKRHATRQQLTGRVDGLSLAAPLRVIEHEHPRIRQDVRQVLQDSRAAPREVGRSRQPVIRPIDQHQFKLPAGQVAVVPTGGSAVERERPERCMPVVVADRGLDSVVPSRALLQGQGRRTGLGSVSGDEFGGLTAAKFQHGRWFPQQHRLEQKQLQRGRTGSAVSEQVGNNPAGPVKGVVERNRRGDFVQLAAELIEWPHSSSAEASRADTRPAVVAEPQHEQPQPAAREHRRPVPSRAAKRAKEVSGAFPAVGAVSGFHASHCSHRQG